MPVNTIKKSSNANTTTYTMMAPKYLNSSTYQYMRLEPTYTNA